MPPGSPMRGLVCRLATWTPCTMSRRSAGKTRSTSPDLPLSRPLMTTTLSPFLIFIFAMSEDLGGQRGDLHEFASAQLTGDRPEHAGADRLILIGDQHRGVAVETDRTAIEATNFLCRTDDDSPMDVALLDAAARDRLLDRDDDHIANARGLAFGAAEHLDALDPARARIVGDVEIGLHLDHAAPPAPVVSASTSAAAARSRRRARPGATPVADPSTTQLLRFEIGRHSSIWTASPAWNLFSSSCAAYFFERVTNFLYTGCITRRSTRTTMVLSPLSLTTMP